MAAVQGGSRALEGGQLVRCHLEMPWRGRSHRGAQIFCPTAAEAAAWPSLAASQQRLPLPSAQEAQRAAVGVVTSASAGGGGLSLALCSLPLLTQHCGGGGGGGGGALRDGGAVRVLLAPPGGRWMRCGLLRLAPPADCFAW